MSGGLNPSAAAWCPPQPVADEPAAPPASAPPRWEYYPARGQAADGADYTPDDDDDDDDDDEYDDNMRWAEQQAQMVEQRHAPPAFVPRAFNAPAPVGRPNNHHHTLAAAAEDRYDDDDDDTYSRVGAETTMTNATSVQIGVAVPKATGKTKRLIFAKEAARENRRRLIAEKSGLEAFSAALLHSVSPFMAPLRAAAGSSLPHIKVDQRFGRRGQPHTAVMQFVVAPVVNYRPAHFHDLAPGDVMEYHFDLAQALRVISSAYSYNIAYGDEWKPYALPYAYVACGDYRGEVLKLCPKEIPNSRSDATYEDDIVKDITRLILAVPELEVFKRKSFIAAMRNRANLYPMYAVFASLFAGISNYQIMIRDLNKCPPRFLLKTSESALAKSKLPVTIADSEELWNLLPTVPASTGAPARKTTDANPTEAKGASEGSLDAVLPRADPTPTDDALQQQQPTGAATNGPSLATTAAICAAAIVGTAIVVAVVLKPKPGRP